MRQRTLTALVAALMLLAGSASAQTATHRHQTAIPDDPTKDISSSEWNDSHVFAGGADENLMCRDTGATDGWAWCTVDDFTADGTPDGAADYVLTWDDSASAHKKVLLDNLPGGGGGSPGGSSGDLQTNDGAGGFGAYAGDGCTVGECVTDIASDGTVTCGTCSAGSGGFESTYVRKGSNESVTSSTSLQDDDTLLFAIGANETWEYEFVVFANGSTAGDIKVAVDGPTGSAGTYGTPACMSLAATGAEADPAAKVPPAQGTAPTSVGYGCGTFASTNGPIIIKGLAINGGTAGNVVFRWAQNTSDGTATTVVGNSYLIARQVSP